MSKLRELRTRIVLMKRQVTEDDRGVFTENWEEGDRIWARIIPCFGREIYGEGWNNLVRTQAKYKVTFRYRKARFARVKWDDVVLALLCPPIVDQHKQWMNCMMYEVGDSE